jgi:uncharacterized DUF497 family protein
VEFEFDEKKSTANKVKHGIDFVQAQALRLDAGMVEIPARTEDEPRWAGKRRQRIYAFYGICLARYNYKCEVGCWDRR